MTEKENNTLLEMFNESVEQYSDIKRQMFVIVAWMFIQSMAMVFLVWVVARGLL